MIFSWKLENGKKKKSVAGFEPVENIAALLYGQFLSFLGYVSMDSPYFSGEYYSS